MAGLGAILLVGLLLRLPVGSAEGLWRDEAQLASIAQLPSASSMVGFLVQHESHPPLYYLLYRAWIRAAGPEDAVLQWPSLVFGLLTIISGFIVGRRIQSTATGLLAATLIAVSSTLVLYSRMARPYAFLGLVAVLSTWSYWELLQHPSRRSRAAYVSLTLLLLYTHNWTILVVAGQATVGVLALAAGGYAAPRAAWRSLGVAYALIGALYLPWVPALVLQALHGGHHRPPEPLLETLARQLRIMGGLPVASCLALAVGVLSLRWLRGRVASPASRVDRAEQLAIALCAGTPMLALLGAVALMPWVFLVVDQTFVVLVPCLMLGLAATIAPSDLRLRKAGRTAALASVVALAVWALRTREQPVSNTKAVAELLNRHVEGNDLVVLSAVYAVPSFRRYFHQKVEVYAFPDRELRDPIKFDDRPARDLDPDARRAFMGALDSALNGGRRVWFVKFYNVPTHSVPAYEAMASLLVERAGPPRCEGEVPVPEPLLEMANWQLFVPGGAGKVVCP